MENLGEYLRNQRQERDISIEELAARTRIPLRFVHAIEKNQFEEIPNQVSAKGFLRSYVRYIGIEETSALEAFSKIVQKQVPLQNIKEKDEFLSYLQVNASSKYPFPRKIVFLIGGMISLLLVVAGLLPERKPNLNQKVPAEVVDAKKNGESESAPAVDLLVTDEKVLEKVEEFPLENQETSNIADSRELMSEVNQEPLTLSLKALEASWVQVIIDENETKEALLQVDDMVKWQANERFLLTLGNAGGVQIFLNDRDLGSFGPSGEVVEREITGSTATRNEPPEELN
ncbi:MAG: helix-turn-helix domain-containing protein [Nitrospiria bacterium]